MFVNHNRGYVDYVLNLCKNLLFNLKTEKIMFYHVVARKLNSEDYDFICESYLEGEFAFSEAFRKLFARLVAEGYVVVFKEISL